MVAAPAGFREMVAAFTESGTLDPALKHVLARANFDTWTEKVKAARGCAKPVRMAGAWCLTPSPITTEVFVSHRNARLTLHGRWLLIERVHAGRPVAHVAAELGISCATGHKWVRRYRPSRGRGLWR